MWQSGDASIPGQGQKLQLLGETTLVCRRNRSRAVGMKNSKAKGKWRQKPDQDQEGPQRLWCKDLYLALHDFEFWESCLCKFLINIGPFSKTRTLCRRRQWHPTPVLLPGKSYGWRSLKGCSPWGCWGSDTTERLHFHFSLSCIG